MPRSDVDVVVVGGGAAGIAAARRLREAAIDCLIVEARPRLGGRAWTVIDELRMRARPRLRLAAFGRPQSLGEDRAGAKRRDRQVAAALGAPVLGRRLSARRSARLSVGDECVLHTPRRRRRKRRRRPGRKFSRAGLSLERPDQCAQHIYQRRRMGSRLGERFRPLSRHRRELARGQRLWRADQRVRRKSSPPSSIARCAASIIAASACASRLPRA